MEFCAALLTGMTLLPLISYLTYSYIIFFSFCDWIETTVWPLTLLLYMHSSNLPVTFISQGGQHSDILVYTGEQKMNEKGSFFQLNALTRDCF